MGTTPEKELAKRLQQEAQVAGLLPPRRHLVADVVAPGWYTGSDRVEEWAYYSNTSTVLVLTNRHVLAFSSGQFRWGVAYRNVVRCFGEGYELTVNTESNRLSLLLGPRGQSQLAPDVTMIDRVKRLAEDIEARAGSSAGVSARQSTDETVAPGWYACPTGATRTRWWAGYDWTPFIRNPDGSLHEIPLP